MQTDSPLPHVVAVNDEPTILQVYAEILEEEGFRVTTQLVPFAEPADVVALEPDLLVLDLMMGYLDWGTTFLGMLRADPRTSGLPIVVCTAVEVVEPLATQLAAWHIAVVAKPFDIDVFTDAIRVGLAKRAADPDA